MKHSTDNRFQRMRLHDGACKIPQMFKVLFDLCESGSIERNVVAKKGVIHKSGI